MPNSEKSSAGKIFDKLKNTWSRFRESKVGKILFSNSLSYAVSLTAVAIALSGLFTPISPVIIAVSAIAAVGVGVQAVNETLKIHSLRKLHKENNLLVQNRNAKSQQDYILALEPNLSNILKNELYTPPLEGKNLTQDKHSIKSRYVKNTGRVLVSNLGGAAYIAASIAEGASGNVIGILKATGYGILTATSLINEGLSEKERIEIKTVFKSNINEEYKREDTPNYKNLTQLENYTKEQIIQTLALKKLITDKNYWTMKDEDKKQKFQEIKASFKSEIKENGFNAFCKQNKILVNNEKEGYVKDIVRAMNPFYKNPDTALKSTPLASAMKKNKPKPKQKGTGL